MNRLQTQSLLHFLERLPVPSLAQLRLVALQMEDQEALAELAKVEQAVREETESLRRQMMATLSSLQAPTSTFPDRSQPRPTRA
jgi:hypothetical protein